MLPRLAVAALLGALAQGPAAAQEAFPNRPIRFVVPFAPGGPSDIVARIMAPRMTATLGQPVIVDNRSGANSLVATEALAREAPDGHSLMVSTLSHSVNAILQPQARYDPLRDFSPVGLLAMLPLILVTGPGAPFETVDALVAAARARPGEISYGSAGHGGSAHLAGALLVTLTGTQLTHVPFRGNGPALSEVMAGRVSFIFYPMIGIADHIARGQLRALGVSTPRRHADYPAVPTMAEAGFPGFEDYTQGLGVLAPARTPQPVVERLNAAILASLTRPETNARLKGLGAIVAPSSPDEFAAFLAQDLGRWRRVITQADIRAQE